MQIIYEKSEYEGTLRSVLMSPQKLLLVITIVPYQHDYKSKLINSCSKKMPLVGRADPPNK